MPTSLVPTPLARLTAALVALGATACAAETSRQPGAPTDAPTGAVTTAAAAADSLRRDSAAGDVGGESAAAPADAPAAAAPTTSAAAGTPPAPGANSAAGVATPQVATTAPTLAPGRNKHDQNSFAAAIRVGEKKLAAWPRGPAAAPGSLLPGKRIIAYYGNPNSKKMGVIGEYPEAQMLGMLDRTVQQWKQADPSTPVVPAIHLVATVAQGAPGPDGMWRRRENPKVIEKTYEWAKSRNGVLFVDIQASHSTLRQELPVLMPYLERPDVHLGIDPEFYMHYKREGVRPSSKVGQMMASDVNYAIQTLDQLVTQKKLPPKVLVLHRFRSDMTPDWQNIRPTRNVQVVVHMDGWGPPWLKFDSYHHYVVNEPVQYTGFKLFYHNDTKKGDPLLTPRELLQLKPTLSYIQYQ